MLERETSVKRQADLFLKNAKILQMNRLKQEKKILHLHAHKNGELDIIYANYCTISTKRKSQHYQEE